MKAGSAGRSTIMVIIACLLLFMGVGVLLYPIVGNQIAQWHRRQSVADFMLQESAMTPEDHRQSIELAQRYNDFIFNWQQGQPHENISYEIFEDQLGQVMGTLDIPALNISAMPFYYGTVHEVLLRGLGHFEPSSIPIGGENTRGVITGHSGITNQLLFTEVMFLREGDIFFVNIFGERLAYEIRSFETVLPTEVERINIRPGEDMVTLLTCTPPGINTYRLLVNGFRIPYEEAIAREVTLRNQWNYQMMVLGSLIIGLALSTLFTMRYRYLKKEILSGDSLRVEKGLRSLRRFFRGVKGLFLLILMFSLVIVGGASYGYLRMQEEVSLGVLHIGTDEEAIRERNRSRKISANYEETQIASVTVTNYSDAMSRTFDTVNDWGIGKLLLPDVDIDLPILAGLANINLMTGGATYRMDQRLGQGNYVLLAHSVYGNDTVLFQPLARTQIGQRIYATDFMNVYTYEVIFNQVVVDTQVEFLEDIEEGEVPLITLMRCEGGIGTIHRRVVQGELVEVQPLDEWHLERFNLAREELVSDTEEIITTDGTEETIERELIVPEDPISPMDRITMELATRIISDPVQVALPLFLLLLFPVLVLSMLPNQPKEKKGKNEDYKKIIFDVDEDEVEEGR